MFTNFFRKELHLEKKWWHRALLSLYFISFAITVAIIFYVCFTELKQYVKVEPLSNYYTEKAASLSEIKNNASVEYKVGAADYFSRHKESSTFNFYKDNTFCGTDIANGLDSYTSGGKKIEKFMISEDGQRKYVSMQELANLLESKNINCITIDSFTFYGNDMLNLVNKEYFIEPSQYTENLWLYEYSFIATLLLCLQFIAYATVAFVLIALFYYKVFIYIIFGK